MIEYISDFLFVLLNGTPIASTPFFVVWIILMLSVGVIAFFAPYYKSVLDGVLGVFLCITIFFVMAGVPLAQLYELKECRVAKGNIATDNGLSKDVTVRECRTKDNLNHEFDEWKICIECRMK